MSLEFLTTSLVVVLMPGTGVLYTLAVGLGRGFRYSIAAAFGCTLGIIPAALASIVGLSAVLHTSALAFLVLKYLGVAYLLYMAWSILRDGGALDVKEETDKKGYVKTAVTGTLINVLNPKLSLFFLAFLPQFVSSEGVSSAGITGAGFGAGFGVGSVTGELLWLAFVFMVMTFLVFIGYGAFASYARRAVINRPSVMRWVKRCFAGAFGFLGLRLVFSD